MTNSDPRVRCAVFSSPASVSPRSIVLGARRHGRHRRAEEVGRAATRDARIVNAASLSKQLVERVLAERSRQVELIATAPVGDRRRAAAAARRRSRTGLTKLPSRRSSRCSRRRAVQQVDAGALKYLTDLLPKLDIAEVMVTDQYGYNAVTTSPSSDFVQSDEALVAERRGPTASPPPSRPTTRRRNQTVVELARVIRDGDVAHRRREGEVRAHRPWTRCSPRAAPGTTARRPHRLDRPHHRQLGADDALQVIRGDSTISASRSRTPSSPITATPTVQRAAVGARRTAGAGAWSRTCRTTRRDGYDCRASSRCSRRWRDGARSSSSPCRSAGRFIERRITGPAQELRDRRRGRRCR